MTDRAELGARLAELMGWEYNDGVDLYLQPQPGDDLAVGWSAEDIVSWEGYPYVDQYMREQGWEREARRLSSGPVSVKYEGKFHERWYAETCWNDDGDEPLAACQAAREALEARDE